MKGKQVLYQGEEKERERIPKISLCTRSQTIIQVALPRDKSINYTISSPNSQPKYLYYGSKDREGLRFICFSLNAEINLRAGFMSCLVFMFTIGRTHSRYSKLLERMVEFRDDRLLDFQVSVIMAHLLGNLLSMVILPKTLTVVRTDFNWRENQFRVNKV